MSRFLLVFCFLLTGSPAMAEKLLMIEQAGCEWCETWDNEIGGIYNKTEESQKARLVRHDIDEIATLGYNLVSNIRYTPTFIVLEDNREIGRITGYPGEESFWPMLNSILDQLNQ